MLPFQISFLDHVAIRVKNMEKSAQWYEEILGLKRYQLPAWGKIPILMLAGKTGVAIFPANLKDVALNKLSKNAKIDHFAFNVTNEDFAKAQQYFTKIGLEYEIQDHHYFQSLYLKDPDGHLVELTTLVISDEDFYL